jgi:hypothetical protein
MDIDTHNQLADIGTKNLHRPSRTPLHHHAIGVRFYPAKGTEHYRLLCLETFDKTFREDMRLSKNR